MDLLLNLLATDTLAVHALGQPGDELDGRLTRHAGLGFDLDLLGITTETDHLLQDHQDLIHGGDGGDEVLMG